MEHRDMERNARLEGAQALAVTRPLLKWAGGKTQLLGEIIPKIPKKYGRFIEPFFGGGAVFFAVHPKGGIPFDASGKPTTTLLGQLCNLSLAVFVNFLNVRG